jgi:lipoprotein-anchoring transpeptidase ErfK/SrfK
MRSRAVTTISALLLGLAGTPALAQFLPLPVPRTQQPPFQPPPPAEADDEAPPYDPPPGYRRVPSPQYGRGYPQEVETNQLPPPSGYREPPVPGYEPIEPADPRARVGRSYGDQQPGYQPGYEPDPRSRYGRPGYGEQPGYQQGYQQPGYQQQPEPDPRSRYGNAEPPAGYEPEPPRQGLLPSPLDILRPPAPVGRQQEPAGRQQQEGRQQEGRPPQGGVYAALPPEDRPETGPAKELPAHLRRTVVNYQTREPVGTIIIDTPNTYLYLVMPGGKAMRYGIGVGREGFTWTGAEKVTRMAEWPDWHPPAEMIERQPYLPRFMAGGEGNPLGARALYLGKTLYRIHGTNQPSTIGTFVSSGCIRLTNDDVSDLYQQVKVGTRVVVLPGRPPASANAAPEQPSGPYNPLAPPRTR